MKQTSNVQITIALQDPHLDEEELQVETQRLLQLLVSSSEKNYNNMTKLLLGY
ncbi:MAG TPA: hypothetical protein VK203_12135 [Nostocaceae cyanobacterium]|nr:hypothetical protein [Nostocaceae cyanobacterium]